MVEMFAIHIATDYILDHELYELIVSDSRSALMTVEYLSDEGELIWNIKKELKGREDIKLMRVKAHRSETGNEQAYMLAKDAANKETIDAQFIY
ncbi:hypothetical protein AVEN_16973-1 [Araneus ventricosus]|uniref:RNase H type-1 domain-containing protein n=1 Tax=Araneus ventricosus TaxID=182803 RepID=A0A4Y2D4H3_ARAVE|nr:hypothetical protein AVEN_16973-1 [Araneus ventricosus]